VFVGRLKHPKDVATLLEAASLLDAGSFALEIVGDGPDRAAAERAAHGLTGVDFAGERGDVAERLAAADVFVLSSRSAGLPISVLEAMAAGLPVVGSDVGGLRELVVDGDTGLLVPAGDPQALADALLRLLSSPEERAAFGAAGRARAAELFGLERFRDEHV